jgi:uncharacterized protein (DUF433 family)
VAFGKPVVAGARVPVAVILGQLAAGVPTEEIGRVHELEPGQVLAALRHAAWLAGRGTVRARARRALGRILVDESLPRAASPTLTAAGHDVEDVRDVGLRGRPDAGVTARARAERSRVHVETGSARRTELEPP